MLPDHFRILVVDDEPPIREVLSQALKDEGYTVWTAADGVQALEKMAEVLPHLVFLDIWMPGSLDGLGVLLEAKKRHPEIQVVMISGHGTIETAVKATKLGAWDFIEKPLSLDRVMITVNHVRQFLNERDQKKGLISQMQKQISLVGSSAAMSRLRATISLLANKDQRPILLVGERGTGRHLVAQNIHFQSVFAGFPFIEINLMNVPLDLMDYELWGWENGVLTGHPPSGIGKVQMVSQGTLFLRNIDQLSENSQRLLLNFIQQKQYIPVGGSQAYPLQARFIFAIDPVHRKQLLPEWDEFALIIDIPPLRERKEDLPALFWHFSDHWIRQEGGTRKELSAEAINELAKYNWPGNLTEFRNFVERLYLLTPHQKILVHDLHFAGLPSTSKTDFLDFRAARAQFEKQFLEDKLREFSGNISKMAEAIGLERSYLHRKLKSYGISEGKDDS